TGWVRGMGQYKRGLGNDRQFFLSAWSGKSVTVDRKAQNGVPVHIARPFLCVVGGVPPDMLGELADHRGRSDGFVHRILFSFPPSPAAADWTEETVTQESADAWARVLAALRTL